MKRLENISTKLQDGAFTPREILLTGAVLFLGGVLIGVFTSPRGLKLVGSLNGTMNECGDQCGSVCSGAEAEEEA